MMSFSEKIQIAECEQVDREQAQEEGVAPSMAIASAADPASSHWTAIKPSQQIAARLIVMARRSLQAVEVGLAG